MGRKKGAPGGGDVNPLQRMLGTFLRLERSRLGYSSADVARRLGLTDTYFRLAESGRAALNQALVFRVIEVFAASSAQTHETRAISFSRFALYLVGTHWVGAEMAAHNSKGVARRAFESLAALVSDFQTLYERTRRYFELEEGSTDQKRFLEDVVAPEVGEFLRSEYYGAAAGSDNELLRLDELPTLNVEILLDLKQSLAGRSFVHTEQIASRWEADRASQFRFQRGLFRSPKLIVSAENLNVFHYDFLDQSRFAESQLILVDSLEDERALKREFLALLNRGRARRRNLPEISERGADKIKFVCLSADERRAHKDEIEGLLRRDSRDHEAYWSFETHAGLDISFIGVSAGNAENIRNLNLRDASERAQTFERLWSTVYAAHQD
jgi:transcriptional regulator with XRE-family HTH domain